MPVLTVWGLRLACLFLGVALRLARPDLVAFKLDEAKFVGIVDSAATGAWPASGAMSSWGVLQPPLRAYLLAPARWLTTDVTAVTVLLGLFSVANLGAIGLAAARFSRIAAVGAVALACASPWVLHFGRALWDAPIPVFGTLALYAALRAGDGNSRWGLVVCPLLVLQALTHLTALSVLPLAIYLAGRFRSFRTRWFAAGAALGAAMALPYVVTVLAGPEPLGQTVGARTFSNPLSSSLALQFALWFVSGADIQSLLGEAHAPEYPFSFPLALGPFVAALLLVAGAVACVRGRASPLSLWERPAEGGAADIGRVRAGPPGARRREEGEILLAWVVIPLLVTMVLPGQLFVHYFQSWGGGAPFVLAGVGFAWLMDQLRAPILRWLAVAALAVIPLVQAGSWIALLDRLERHPDTAVGPTLGAWQDLAGATRTAARDGRPALTPTLSQREREPVTVLVWTAGDQPAYQDKPAVLNLLLGPQLDPAFLRRDSAVLFESARTVFVSTPPRSEPRWGFVALPGIEQVRTTAAGGVWTAGPALRAPAGNPADPPVPFADGLVLEGHATRTAPGTQQVELVTFWRVAQPSDRARTADLTLFVHLEDSQQRRVGQDDGLDWPSRRWLPGMRIAQSSLLDTSGLAGDGWVRLGVYSRQDLQRSPRLDTGEDSVLVGPIQRPTVGAS